MSYVHCAGCPKVKISTYILCKVFTSKHVKYTLCAGCSLSNSCHLQMYNIQHINLNMYNIHCAECPIIYTIYICSMSTLYNIHCAGCPIVITSAYIQCKVCTSNYALCTLCWVSNSYNIYLYTK